jgi:hypothetical protein
MTPKKSAPQVFIRRPVSIESISHADNNNEPFNKENRVWTSVIIRYPRMPVRPTRGVLELPHAHPGGVRVG